jgi:hypothetical protein
MKMILFVAKIICLNCEWVIPSWPSDTIGGQTSNSAVWTSYFFRRNARTSMNRLLNWYVERVYQFAL